MNRTTFYLFVFFIIAAACLQFTGCDFATAVCPLTFFDPS